MKRIIVACYSVALEIILCLVIIAGGVAGYNLHVWWGIPVGLLAGFIVDVILFAPLCVLLDMWEIQKSIREDVEKIAGKGV